jgi:hypothetical protein
MNGAGCGVAMGATLSSEDDLPSRDRWARLRFAIIGPLLAAPPAAGELHEALTVLAAKTWRHPFTGIDVTCWSIFGPVDTLRQWLFGKRGAHEEDKIQRGTDGQDSARGGQGARVGGG